jgi:A/G-specific adenine glycosylase
MEALPNPVLFGRGGARTLTEVGEEATRTNGFELDAAKAEAVRGTLIPWFEENGRDLPWRRTRDPWRVLVSEVMLQQIQVTRAVPFYESFVALFPTPRALSEAPLSEAIRAWGDLGRYRRVVSLHRTAHLIVEEHGGEVPSDPEALVELPGVGPYTAGAVACFAFERDAHFLDTNIRRVLHRLFFGAEVPEPKAKESQLLGLAEAMVPRDRAWGWGQSVMELGALRCKARKPLCAACPVSELCAARPTIAEALARRPYATRATQGRGGSNRYYRGRVLAVLREAPPEGVALGELGKALREGFGEADLPWLRGVVESLRKDGLARISSEKAWSVDPPQTTVLVNLP